MSNQDSGRLVRAESQFWLSEVAAERVRLALHGAPPDPELEEVAERLTAVLWRAGAVEATEPQVAAAEVIVEGQPKSQMEWLDAGEFARRRQLRLRMASLRTKRASR